ncbi:MAG TPA: helix-turn-helix domain-containing protein [Dermatophilaceae bacterium]|nr:helix-turn-helix domain-containing protein [Dermatophilaceae bacterium]
MSRITAAAAAPHVIALGIAWSLPSRGPRPRASRRPECGPATICTVVDTYPECAERVAELDESLPELRALAKARAASERADAARDRTRQQLREAVLGAVAAGIPEAEVARRSGVTRMTVRAWIGK